MSTFDEVTSRRALIKLVEGIAQHPYRDPALRGAVAVFAAALVLYRDAVRQEVTGAPAEHRSVRAEQTDTRIIDLERQLAEAETANTRMRTKLDAARRMLDPDDCALVDEMLATVNQWRTRAKRAESASNACGPSLRCLRGSTHSSSPAAGTGASTA
ncbi:hypothetical protein ACFXJ6_21065 [Streptomyces sp. NPDC059218]|uniref:hypothetical protein n=1 Tax=unclassified Streptomyces TaxID=2593676 RepID=UPI00369A0846